MSTGCVQDYPTLVIYIHRVRLSIAGETRGENVVYDQGKKEEAPKIIDLYAAVLWLHSLPDRHRRPTSSA